MWLSKLRNVAKGIIRRYRHGRGLLSEGQRGEKEREEPNWENIVAMHSLQTTLSSALLTAVVRRRCRECVVVGDGARFGKERSLEHVCDRQRCHALGSST